MSGPPGVYHRLTSHKPDEEALVRSSGQLWGKAKSAFWGGGKDCVQAYVGPLPERHAGYSFTTEVRPTRVTSHMGRLCAVWEEDSPGVFDVTEKPPYVGIKVTVIRT